MRVMMVGRRPSMFMGSIVAVGCGVAMLKEASYLSEVMTVARKGASLSPLESSSESPDSSSSSTTSVAYFRTSQIEAGALHSWLEQLVRSGDDGERSNDSNPNHLEPSAVAAPVEHQANHNQGSEHEGTSPLVLELPPLPAHSANLSQVVGSQLVVRLPVLKRPPPPPPPKSAIVSAAIRRRRRPPSAPMREFYSVARTDRSGASILDMILALAHGYATNTTYKGACYVKDMTFDGPRRQADKDALIHAIGLQGTLVYACPPENQRKRLIVHRDTYFNNRQSLLSPAFLDWLRSKVRTVSRAPGGSAIVHVRRGDVDPCKMWRDRYLPNSYYLDVLRRHVPPDVPVTVFSESAAYENFTDFENANITMRLDTEVSQVWEAVMAASHVVLSRSSFAYVPALLNGNAAVVYPTNFAVAIPPTWKRADNDIVKRSDRRVTDLTAPPRCKKYKAVQTGRSFYNSSR